jgi:hypothetical protein
MPNRYANYALGLSAYLAGASDSAVAALRAALLPDPDWAEAWAMLGEVYYHQFPHALAPLDSLADAAFATALKSDSGFAPAMPHLIEGALRRGEVERSRSLLVTYQASGADPESWHSFSLALECLAAGSGTYDWATAAQRDSTATLFAAKLLATAGAQPRCAGGALTGLAASGAYSYPALGLLTALDAAQHRTLALAARLDSNLAAGNRAATVYVVMAAAAGLQTGDSGAAFIGRLHARRATLPVEWVWWLGSLAGQQGDTALLRQIRHDGERLAPGNGPELLALDAALARTTGDTVRALALYRQLLSRPASGELDWDLRAPRPVERLALAQLELAHGEALQAWATASVFDGRPLAFLPYLPASLEVRIAALDRLGRPEQARLLHRRLEALRRP